MAIEKKYRYHRRGTIHYIPGCCYWGSNPKESNPDNFEECFTYDEAVQILKSKHVSAMKCQRCDWSQERECE